MTAQYREELTLDGEVYRMITEPLESYLNNHFNFKHDGIYPYILEYCTALWRGYIGVWLIADDQLFLTNMEADPGFEKNKILIQYRENDLRYVVDWRKTFFNSQQGNIKADWFTGVLELEIGKSIQYHSTQNDIYEKYMYIKIEKGHVKKKWTEDGQPINYDNLY